jgi:hypothetical protein
LLSEKLSTAEIPLQEHLHEVCQRAIVEEEMTRLIEAAYQIGPGYPAPDYDPNYICPLTVEKENFIDHTIEIEVSKSFPGLLTMYHLYTVEIVCSGLPGVDFNTLEYAPPDKEGVRKLKYIHAWSWLEWPQIQRYLFEGSERKETKKKGSFKDEAAFRAWLQQFDLDLDAWGQKGLKRVKDLFWELEEEQTRLEVWGRHDGVSLLMRVAHVIQLEVTSSDPRLQNKLLFQTWQQGPDGKVRAINRLPSKKLSFREGDSFNEMRFVEAAENAMKNQFTRQTDVHFRMFSNRIPKKEDFPSADVKTVSVGFRSSHNDVEESPSYKGIHTMYHLYCMDMEVEGLEVTDFTTVDFSRGDRPSANGWKWATWGEILDILHSRTQTLLRKEASHTKSLSEQGHRVEATTGALSRLALAVGRMATEGPGRGEAAAEAKTLIAEIQEELACMQASVEEHCVAKEEENLTASADILPPDMVSKMASQQIAVEDLLNDAMARRASQRPTSASVLAAIQQSQQAGGGS